MSIFLVGAHGLVGAAFLRFFERSGIPFRAIGRKDMQSISGMSCDVLINCSGNGNKGRAANDPHWDFSETVTSTAHYLHQVKSKRFVQISSVDIYGDTSSETSTAEDRAFDSLTPSVYGFHKQLAEQMVLRFSTNPLILRLPALVAPDLKKNPIYDHFAKDKKLFISGQSRLNIIHTDTVAAITMQLLEGRLEHNTFNLAASNSIDLTYLETLSGAPLTYNAGAQNNIQHYEINTTRLRQYVDIPDSQSAVQQYMREISAY